MVDNFKKHFFLGGLKPYQTEFHKNTISVFNTVNFSLLVCLHISFLVELIGQHPKGIVFSILFILISHFIIWLNRKGHFDIAASMFCLVLPGGVFLLALGYSKVLFIDFYFAVFFICIILFIRLRAIRLTYTMIYLAMYFYIHYFKANNAPLFGFEFSVISNVVVLMIFSLIFWMLTYLMMSRLKNAEHEKDRIFGELQATNAELEETSANMERVSAMASHDLKTPIRNIKSMVGLMAIKNKDTALSPIIDDIEKLSGNMINVIDQTIEHNRAKNIIVSRSIIELNEVLDHIINLIGTRFGPFELKRSHFVPFEADSIVISKVLQNLVENGVKYNTSQHKVISVIQEIKEGRMLISVSDNGIGIDEKYRKQVFGMYSRLHNSDEFPGTGLGLAICKRLAEQMDGALTLECNKFGGSTFVLNMPYAIGGQPETEIPSHSSQPVVVPHNSPSQ